MSSFIIANVFVFKGLIVNFVLFITFHVISVTSVLKTTHSFQYDIQSFFYISSFSLLCAFSKYY